MTQGTNKLRAIKMLQSSANGLKRDCPVHEYAKKNHLCYATAPYICARRRALFKISKPNQYVTVQIVDSEMVK